MYWIVTCCPSSDSTMIPFQQLMTGWKERPARWHRWRALEAQATAASAVTQ
jgi:hypothetical protein